jgi:hypothetical protein
MMHCTASAWGEVKRAPFLDWRDSDDSREGQTELRSCFVYSQSNPNNPQINTMTSDFLTPPPLLLTHSMLSLEINPSLS